VTGSFGALQNRGLSPDWLLIGFSNACAPTCRLNHYEPPLSSLLPFRMGIIAARIEAWTVRSSLQDGIL